MKKRILQITAIFFAVLLFGQKEKELPKKDGLLKSSSNSACKCIDSINYKNGDKEKNNEAVSNCIDKQVAVYQLGIKLIEVTESAVKSGQKNVNIDINTNKNSQEYKDSYYDIQRNLLENCNSLKKILAALEYKSDLGKPTNQKAIEFYNLGIKESNNENWGEAVKYYEKAVKEDPNFAFAWDNLGLCNRRLGNLDKALEAYQKSLAINPSGKLPLQNIPAVLSRQEKYQEAIEAFKNLDKYYPGDAEVYYGIGQIYYEHLKEYEKSLDYMCKAFNIYTKENSAYRGDAEKIIAYIYKIMKGDGKLDKFNEILKNNNISPVSQ